VLEIEITHDKRYGYGIDVVSDKNVRHNHQLHWTHNHNLIVDMVEEILNDYRSD